jgi:UDP-3-O-[3-hydroxymyristoyl] glucosamine N-acyltransferase
MKITASQLAQMLDGIVEGDPEIWVSAPAKIEEAEAGTLAFLANPKYENFAYSTRASILLVEKNFQPRRSISATLVRVENVRNAVAFLLKKIEELRENEVNSVEISSKSEISPSAKLGKNVSVGAFSIIEAGAEIGENCRLAPQVFVGKNVKIGANSRLEPGVKILFDCRIGENCLIHSGTVIGSDGFGFAPQNDGSWAKIPQIGNVIIENDVEIGANCTIDRATMGSTRIARGAKIDNLCHLAHNVEIGEHVALAAQVGIAGSTKIGARVQMGGQVGIVGHISIAEGTKIQAQSGVAGAIKEPDTAIFGSPAIGYLDFQRSFILFKKLPEIWRKLNEIDKKTSQKEV